MTLLLLFCDSAVHVPCLALRSWLVTSLVMHKEMIMMMTTTMRKVVRTKQMIIKGLFSSLLSRCFSENPPLLTRRAKSRRKYKTMDGAVSEGWVK